MKNITEPNNAIEKKDSKNEGEDRSLDASDYKKDNGKFRDSAHNIRRISYQLQKERYPKNHNYSNKGKEDALDSDVIAYYKSLPYRPGVGMMIVNSQNMVFVGRRIDTKMEAWQMPQGGINLGETPSAAALREMHEEIGSNKGHILAESRYWYSYDLPKFLIPRLWDGNFRGQKQKWFLIRFTGNDADINIHNNDAPEFSDYRWVHFEKLSSIIIPFKRKLYNAVINEFKDIIAS